jgi:hypothetical protein
MVNGSPRYATANAFRRALEDRLKSEAKARGRSLEELRREFLFQRFLALIFSVPDIQWVLKGGAGLLMRLTEARFSKDLDLLHMGKLPPDAAISELRELTAPRDGDHLTFVIEDGVAYSRTNPVVEISVTAYIGARYGSFPTAVAGCLVEAGQTDPVGGPLAPGGSGMGIERHPSWTDRRHARRVQ